MTTKIADSLKEDMSTFDAAGFAADALSSPAKLAAVIDHTLLKPEATREQVRKLCREAAEHRFGCVMINPVWVEFAVQEMQGTGVPVGVVIGFPLGASLASTKRQEAMEMVRLGAHDLDMVLSVGQFKGGNLTAVECEIRTLAKIAHDNGGVLKVILETCLLTTEEKLRAGEVAINGGTDFLKTSTGFSSGGATVADIAMLRGVAGTRCGVKASGGIRTLADTRAMLEAGANRIGASAGIKILAELLG
jgi:deoxyribose-phosphate aldolase